MKLEQAMGAVKAASDLLRAIDTNHDTKPSPKRYAIPYGEVNALRAALSEIAPPDGCVIVSVERLKQLGVYDQIAQEKPAPVADRCPLCRYQHGHQIGCENNPLDIALRAAAPDPQVEKVCELCLGVGTVAMLKDGELVDVHCSGCGPEPQGVPEPVVTDAMALAFHRELSDSGIGLGEVEIGDIKRGLRAALAAALAAAPEPNWNHPKIQGLIGSEARLRIAIDLVWKILEDPNQEFSAGDMEYWDTLHDDIKAALAAAPDPQGVPEPADEDAPTAEELEAFRRKHWQHWSASENLLIAHLVQKLRCAQPQQSGAAQPEQERKPLREDAVDECYGNSDVIGYKAFVAGFRAAERHHNITPKD